MNKTIYSSNKNLFIIDKNISGFKRQEGLCFSKKLVNNYLSKGLFKSILKDKVAVGMGFVDGDLEILYTKKSTT